MRWAEHQWALIRSDCFAARQMPDVAREFIAFVMSIEGQKLWNWKVGAPGGPQRYALRRLPVLPQLYAPDYKPLRSDPEVNPYELAKTFTYHEKWSAPLFRSIAFIFRVMCIDTHHELTKTWQALIAAKLPAGRAGCFRGGWASRLRRGRRTHPRSAPPDKMKEVQLAKELSDTFRAQYQRAATLARDGKSRGRGSRTRADSGSAPADERSKYRPAPPMSRL